MLNLGVGRHAHADDVIESLFPIDGSGLIAVIRCGVDASNRDGGIFTVAAVAYEMGKAKKANKKWEKALGGKTFHMTDLNARKKEFKGISDKEGDLNRSAQHSFFSFKE